MFIVIMPFIINYAYLEGTPDGKPNTVFTASDMLDLYGVFVSVLFPIVIAIVAFVYQQKNHSQQMFLEKSKHKALFAINNIKPSLPSIEMHNRNAFYTTTIHCENNNLEFIIELENIGNDIALEFCRSTPYFDGKQEPSYYYPTENKIPTSTIGVNEKYSIKVHFKSLQNIGGDEFFNQLEMEDNRIYTQYVSISYKNLEMIKFTQKIKIDITKKENACCVNVYNIGLANVVEENKWRK